MAANQPSAAPTLVIMGEDDPDFADTVYQRA